MTDEPGVAQEFESSVNPEQASRLLRVAISGPDRPVDDLLCRLAESDGAAWLTEALTAGPVGTFGPPQRVLCEGTLTLDQLLSIKKDSTALAAKAPDPPARLAAMAGYFFAVAAGLAHFGRNTSSRKREQLEPTLLDLAAVTPEVWSKLFVHAAAALSSEA